MKYAIENVRYFPVSFTQVRSSAKIEIEMIWGEQCRHSNRILGKKTVDNNLFMNEINAFLELMNIKRLIAVEK